MGIFAIDVCDIIDICLALVCVSLMLSDAKYLCMHSFAIFGEMFIQVLYLLIIFSISLLERQQERIPIHWYTSQMPIASKGPKSRRGS